MLKLNIVKIKRANSMIIDIKEENKKADIILDNMLSILSCAHRLAKVTINTKDINNTIKNYNRETAIFLIAQNVLKYANILNALSSITGYYIIYKPNFYDDKTDETILCDLKYIRNVIYFNEIKNAGLEFLLKKALKKLNII